MWIPIFMNIKQVQHFCRYSKSQAEANARKGSEFFYYFSVRCTFYHQDINQVHRIRENPVLYLLNSISKLKPEKGFVDRSVYTCFCVCICRQKYSVALRFYPMLDVDELYKILTTEKSLLLAHPQLANEEVDERMVRASFFSICSSLSLKKSMIQMSNRHPESSIPHDHP